LPSPNPVHWCPTALPPALADDAIHVWRLSSSMPPDELLAWLDDRERQRLDGMHHPEARRQLLASRIGLRRVLAGYLGCQPFDVHLQVAEGGKPFVAGGPEFNLSHCQDMVLLAVARVPVGIDVEALRHVPRADRIARRVLDPATVAQLATLPEGERDAAFIQAWTAMEARQKCLGQGVFGQHVAQQTVRELAFRPDVEHHAQLAWAVDLAAPSIHWLAQSGSDHDLS
jgi:4'-phosphopantetheinyl transferase